MKYTRGVVVDPRKSLGSIRLRGSFLCARVTPATTDTPRLEPKMTDIVVPTNSPFDAIRQVREDGTEYWSARDLMPLLGYNKWQAFDTAIERAITSAKAQNASVEGNFTGAGKVSGERGPAQKDYHLSRFASYLVAMNGDPRKEEVAAAQAYFAVPPARPRPSPANS